MEVTGYDIVYVYEDEHKELNEHPYHIAGAGTEWHYEAWEIDFAEDSGIGSEDIAAVGEAGAEVVPQCDACHIEQWLWDAIGADACQSSEDAYIHNGGEEGLDDVPQRTEDCLFVLRNDVTLDIHIVQVSVSPESLDVNIEPFFLWLNV